jgi:FixJ family two-component response regulator
MTKEDHASELACLTARERDVLQLYVKGFNTEEVCDRLAISRQRVKNIRWEITTKMETTIEGACAIGGAAGLL